MQQALMLEKHLMAYRSKFALTLIFALASGLYFCGCISYQMIKRLDGDGFRLSGNELRIGDSTLKTALLKFGAPDQLISIQGRDVLLYRRIVFRQNRLSLGIPVFDTVNRGVDFSVVGGLESYDTLALFFTPDKILRQIIVEKSADRPFLKTMLEK
jgi:hypothetical protein